MQQCKTTMIRPQTRNEKPDSSSVSRQQQGARSICAQRRCGIVNIRVVLSLVSFLAALFTDNPFDTVSAFVPKFPGWSNNKPLSSDTVAKSILNSFQSNKSSPALRRCTMQFSSRLESLGWNQEDNGDEGSGEDAGSKKPPSEESTKRPSRIRAKFDNLFSGMPSVSEILTGERADGGGFDEKKQQSSDSSSEETRKKRRKAEEEQDNSWFKEEKQQIELNYLDIFDDMLNQLEEQRKVDPDSVPENAEAMIRSVLNDEMDTEIDSTRELRAREQLEDYEQQLRSDTELKDISGPPDETVQKLIDESEEEYMQWEASRAQLDEFMRYEKEAFRKATEEPLDMEIPASGANLDEWALRSLEAMADSRQDMEGGELVLEILEENVDDLRQRLEKEVEIGSIQPKTMKEWQMYRAIATRLALDDSSTEADNRDDDRAKREQRILAQLESWKDYIQKEAFNREESGLARGPKLPFEWQESDLTNKPVGGGSAKSDKRSRIEVRKEINRMSIEALESLMLTSDPSRRENLKREVDYLKSTLESRDYLDIEEEEMMDDAVGPVDLSGVFTANREDAAPEKDRASVSLESDSNAAAASSASPPPPPPLPSTPFFSAVDEDSAPPPPPTTPFFSGEPGVAAVDSKLGSMEEQKLQAMYRRGGVRSEEDQARIKKEWEDFQIVEEEKRKQSGLSSGSDSDGLESANLRYNISDVLREDGDIDAEKVLASIGPRPSRTKKQSTSDAVAGRGSSMEEQGPSLESSIEQEEVRDSLYRAVSAVGGGRYKDDPDARARQQASYEEYLEKEDDMRRALDNIDETKLGVDLEPDSVFDDVEYAEDVISSLGPRPQPVRSRIVNEGEFSDMGGILASKDGDVEDGGEGEGEDESTVWASMPDWLRKEKTKERDRDGGTQGRFLGSEIDDVFDDDDYDKNMRQLHEYEQRRAGRLGKQKGIDISDVLGRRAYETDDYADYKYDDDSFRGRQGGGWGASSFSSRKKTLLEYTELDIRELNSLMDHKDSPYSTGVSQYLPRINRPFKEFGAVFRLEGVLIDITGLQFKAWRKVAEQFEFKPPEIEDVRRAAVIRPEVAVKDAFFWTDDFIECRKAAMAHREAFHDVFAAWTKEIGVDYEPAASEVISGVGSFVIGEEVLKEEPATPELSASAPTSPLDLVGSSTKAWTALAEAFGKPVPSQAELFHAASLSSATAIRAAFLWSNDSNEVEEIAQAYSHYMQTGSLPESARSSGVERSLPRRLLDESAIMEIHYFAWKKVAERCYFEPPNPEEAMAAFVINDPEVAIRDGFGWTEDPNLLKEVLAEYQATLSELLSESSIIGSPAPVLSREKEAASTKPSKAQPSGPTPEELLQIQIQSWTTTAESHGFSLLNPDLVQLAQKMEPREAISRLFRWTEDRGRIDAIAATYIEALTSLSRKYIRKYGLEAGKAPTQASREMRTGPSQDEIFRAVFDAWVAVAKKAELPEPDFEQVQFALSVGAEEAILTGFNWTDDASEAQKLLESYKREIGIRRQQWTGSPSTKPATASQTDDDVPPYSVTPYASDWVKSLYAVEMGCCIVSYLERGQVDVLLDVAGLSELFGRDCRVSASDGYGEDSQQLLGAALRLERRPDHCVVFDTSPYASIAAHEVDMRNVNIIGVYPRYELLAADSTTDSFSELSAMNIRRLFGERVYDQPLLETQQAQPKTQRLAKTQFWDEE